MFLYCVCKTDKSFLLTDITMARKTSISTWRNRVYKVLAKLDKNAKFSSSIAYSYRKSDSYFNKINESILITVHHYDGTKDLNGLPNSTIVFLDWITSYNTEEHNKELFNKITNIVNEAQG